MLAHPIDTANTGAFTLVGMREAELPRKGASASPLSSPGSPQLEASNECDAPPLRSSADPPCRSSRDRSIHFDPFRPLSIRKRALQRQACLRTLRLRDGELDFPNRILSQREAYFDQVAKRRVFWTGAMDRKALMAHVHRTGRPRLDPRSLWLCTLAKAQESEQYGVEVEIKRFLWNGHEHASEDELYIILEEQYHGRILAEACRAFGIEASFQKPRLSMRILIHLMEYLPQRMRYILVICGEVLGSAVFQLLWERTDLFSAQPEVEEHLRSLLSEILRDEVCHVLHCQSRLGPVGLRIARQIVPLAARILMNEVPELTDLGCDRKALISRLQQGLEIPPGLEGVVANG